MKFESPEINFGLHHFAGPGPQAVDQEDVWNFINNYGDHSQSSEPNSPIHGLSVAPDNYAFHQQQVMRDHMYRYNIPSQPMLLSNYSVDPYSPELPTYCYDSPSPHNAGVGKFYGITRRSVSKMPLSELYEVMGLSDDQLTAMEREEHIMNILEKEGFEVGEKTWIRDTDEATRRAILEKVYNETWDSYGYPRRLLEAIIRRGTYARMQSNLRRRRRRRQRAAGKAQL